MTLELKHIAPYLPYGLYFQCIDIESGEYEELPLTALILTDGKQDLIIGNQECDIDDLFANEYEAFYPILRPLSDLTKDDKFSELINEELICGAWKFVHDDWTTSIQTSNNQHTLLIIQNEVAPECTVLFFNYMIENHYDVFGLIEQGLAIDINTLEK